MQRNRKRIPRLLKKERKKEEEKIFTFFVNINDEKMM